MVPLFDIEASDETPRVSLSSHAFLSSLVPFQLVPNITLAHVGIS